MPETDPKAALRDIWSVSRINREARAVLTGAFPLLWVEGEISNLKRYRSGHWYFSLKDEAAQVSCAMFRNRNALVDFLPDDGMRVMIRARVELYENRGQFQLIAEHMEEAGEGALRRAFEQLKNKLNAEGLFDTARKREIPRLPARIAVVTSPDGAAIKDILSVLGRRFPAIPVDIYGVSVQGDKAAPEIAHALDAVAAHGKAELVILARGGGSLEDLWAFNEELVARAIVDCPVPVISGVGHEVDFTIADFVADRRAPTPSAAAEAAVPDRQDLNALLNRDLGRLRHWRDNRFAHAKHRLSNLQQRLQSRSPHAQLQQRAQRL
ncbi:MAG: exodeoxyribonuclease VII large subunit, partial [Gammaproteobacteria bacterium]